MDTPFKFLDAYSRSDRSIFFGRDAEIDQLYDLVFKSPLVLIYGLSGTGKTSLIQCGLANRFDGPDWYPFFIRRQDDINQNLEAKLRRAFGKHPFPKPYSLQEAVRELYRLELRPVYLIFDQFEELLLTGTESEKRQFTENLRLLLREPLVCKVLLVLREEFLGALYPLEKSIPTIQDFRLRVEPMSRKNAEQVVLGTTKQLGIELLHPQQTIPAILDQVSERKTGIQLSYLQIYLDRLYREYVSLQVPRNS